MENGKLFRTTLNNNDTPPLELEQLLKIAVYPHAFAQSFSVSADPLTFCMKNIENSFFFSQRNVSLRQLCMLSTRLLTIKEPMVNSELTFTISENSILEAN